MSEHDERSVAQPGLDIPATLNEESLAAIEALLFVAGEPIEISVLATALDWPAADVGAALDALGTRLKDDGRGVILQRHGNRAQLTSAPRFGPLVSRMLSVERTTRLSEAALETLAIIAYRQPVTRAEIEAVRGVDSSGVLSTLIARELIEETGRRSTPGNPIEYGTTDAFLRHFGLTSLDELPGEIDERWASGPNHQAAHPLD